MIKKFLYYCVILFFVCDNTFKILYFFRQFDLAGIYLMLKFLVLY